MMKCFTNLFHGYPQDNNLIRIVNTSFCKSYFTLTRLSELIDLNYQGAIRVNRKQATVSAASPEPIFAKGMLQH